MDNPKFIILEDGSAFIFPPIIKHYDFAANFVRSNNKVVSAGFVYFDQENVPHPYGESISLGIESREGNLDEKRLWKIYAPQAYEDNFVI